VLIGGTGRDRLRGDRGEDILIGGSTNNENDEAALKTALTAWLNDDLSEALLNLGSIADDGERDYLTGGKGRDELIGGAGDKLKR
jgi:Ca2+-binding RTX toxin-like protein